MLMLTVFELVPRLTTTALLQFPTYTQSPAQRKACPPVPSGDMVETRPYVTRSSADGVSELHYSGSGLLCCVARLVAPGGASVNQTAPLVPFCVTVAEAIVAAAVVPVEGAPVVQRGLGGHVQEVVALCCARCSRRATDAKATYADFATVHVREYIRSPHVVDMPASNTVVTACGPSPCLALGVVPFGQRGVVGWELAFVEPLRMAVTEAVVAASVVALEGEPPG